LNKPDAPAHTSFRRYRTQEVRLGTLERTVLAETLAAISAR